MANSRSTEGTDHQLWNQLLGLCCWRNSECLGWPPNCGFCPELYYQGCARTAGITMKRPNMGKSLLLSSFHFLPSHVCLCLTAIFSFQKTSWDLNSASAKWDPTSIRALAQMLLLKTVWVVHFPGFYNKDLRERERSKMFQDSWMNLIFPLQLLAVGLCSA